MLGYLFCKFFPVFWKAQDLASNRAFMKWAKAKLNKGIFIYFALMLVLTPLFAFMLHLSGYYGLIFIIIASLGGIYGSIYSSALSGWEYFLPVGLAGIIGAAAKLIAGYIIVLFFPSASAVLLSFVIGSAVGLLSFILFYKRYFPGKGKEETGGNGWQRQYYAKFNFRREMGHVFVFTLLLAILGNVDIFLVKSLTSAELTGFYGALHTLGTVILTLNAAIIASVSPSVYAAGHRRERAGLKTVLFAYGAIALVSAGGSLLFAVFPGLVVRMLFGARYLSVSNNLWLFGPLVFFLSVLMLEANFAYARHIYRVSLALLATIALATLGVAFFHASIREIALATTAAFMCGYILVLCLNLLSRKKRFLEAQPIVGI